VGGRNHKFFAVIIEVPRFRVPDFKTIPWLPHPDNTSGSSVNPDMVRSLGPVVNFHLLLNVLNEQVLSSNKAAVSSFWVHEVIVERVNIDTERLTRVGADALLDIKSKVVNNPHVSFNMSNLGGDVSWERLNIQRHLKSIVSPVVDE